MRAEIETFQRLAGNVALIALVGDKIYPDTAPQQISLPMIVFERTGTLPTWTIHGQLVASVATISVYCWAVTRFTAEDIGEAVIAAMAPEHVSVTRAALFDADMNNYADVIDFEVWE